MTDTHEPTAANVLTEVPRIIPPAIRHKLSVGVMAIAMTLMTASVRAEETLSLSFAGPALDTAGLEAATGRYELPSGVVLMFGLAQTLSVDGVQRWSSAWNMTLGNGMVTPVTPAADVVNPPIPNPSSSAIVLMNQRDAATLQQWQTVTVGLSRLGDPALAGLASRVSRLVIPGLP